MKSVCQEAEGKKRPQNTVRKWDPVKKMKKAVCAYTRMNALCSITPVRFHMRAEARPETMRFYQRHVVVCWQVQREASHHSSVQAEWQVDIDRVWGYGWCRARRKRSRSGAAPGAARRVGGVVLMSARRHARSASSCAFERQRTQTQCGSTCRAIQQEMSVIQAASGADRREGTGVRLSATRYMKRKYCTESRAGHKAWGGGSQPLTRAGSSRQRSAPK